MREVEINLILKFRMPENNLNVNVVELIELLAKYPKTRKYVENISLNITTFLTWWLEKKTPIPTDTNAIESCFSLVKNRIWSVGKRWGDKGLLNWLQLTLNKIFHPEMWQDLWSKYLLINRDFRLTSLEVNWKMDFGWFLRAQYEVITTIFIFYPPPYGWFIGWGCNMLSKTAIEIVGWV